MFPHTLWHGTSAHLLPLIDAHGLGGRNVMADWRVMEFLQWAFPQLGFDDQNCSDTNDIELLPIQAAVRGGSAGMNFVYGDVYAVGGFEKAASYAQTAPELLSFVRTVVDVASRGELSGITDGLSNFPEISEFLGLDPAPVVLKLPPLPMPSVRSEEGGNFLFDMDANSPESDALISQLAFRVDEVIPLNEIEVFDSGSGTPFNSSEITMNNRSFPDRAI